MYSQGLSHLGITKQKNEGYYEKHSTPWDNMQMFEESKVEKVVFEALFRNKHLRPILSVLYVADAYVGER